MEANTEMNNSLRLRAARRQSSSLSSVENGRQYSFATGMSREEKGKEKEYKRRLAEAREKYEASKKITKQTATIVASVKNPFSLISKINLLSDWTYVASFLVALLKDLLDFIGIGSLPVIGTAVTACVSIFIVMMMLVGNFIQKDRGIVETLLLKRVVVVFVGFLLEIILGLNFIPWQTLSVVVIYLYALAARKMVTDAEKLSVKA